MIKPIGFSTEYLKECFDYDGKAGRLIWRERPGSHFSSPQEAAKWNGRYAGKVAGRKMRTGYIHVNIKGKMRYAHRIIWALHYEDTGKQIDHINRIADDNRVENLRAVDQSTNQKNKGMNANNTSGVNGVRYDGRRWAARLKHNGKTLWLGGFDNLFDAVCARKSAEKRYGFSEHCGSLTPAARDQARREVE